MTAAQINALNVQVWRDMSTIAEDEGMMRRVAKYLRKVVKEMNTDSTLMNKEEFFARVEKARKGPTTRMKPDEDLTTFLRRQGYDI